MRTDELDFHLPPELIAQEPVADRAASRLLHFSMSSGAITHHIFHDLPSLLRRGDVLVFNDSKVVPARFYLTKPTGGQIEGLFLNEPNQGTWTVLLKNAASVPVGTSMTLNGTDDVVVELLGKRAEGEADLRVDTRELAVELLARVGRMPLPPYIRRDKGNDDRDESDKSRYQTVYAAEAGSVAAPTAGLHFTPELLNDLDSAGVERAFVTLHVGMGTFKPVSADTLEDHTMHREVYTIKPETVGVLNRAKQTGRRVIAVGTTTCRVLESQPPGEPIIAKHDSTAIFIRPPYEWRHVDGLITNFHLPRSTLIALVAARVGIEPQRRIYAEAIAQQYRFFSYGDAMFVE